MIKIHKIQILNLCLRLSYSYVGPFHRDRFVPGHFDESSIWGESESRFAEVLIPLQIQTEPTSLRGTWIA